MLWCTVDGSEIPIPNHRLDGGKILYIMGQTTIHQLVQDFSITIQMLGRFWELFLQRSMKQTKRMILPGDSSRDLFIPDRWVGH